MPKIIVSNLMPNLTEEDIRVLFCVFGPITSITHSDLTNSYFISYTTKEECSEAIKSMNGRTIEGQSIYVDMAFERDSKLFVCNIPLNENLTDLKSFFSYYGNINTLSFKNNQLEIIYDNKLDCEKLIALNGKINYKGVMLSIRKVGKKEVSDDKCTLFVYNISKTVSEQDFYNSFVKYGNIISSGILEGGKGYVNFEKEIGAVKSIKYLDNKPIKGKKIKVVLKAHKKRKA